jgi:hypothetical protein
MRETPLPGTNVSRSWSRRGRRYTPGRPGAIAQLGERHAGSVEVAGSSPASSIGLCSLPLDFARQRSDSASASDLRRWRGRARVTGGVGCRAAVCPAHAWIDPGIDPRTASRRSVTEARRVGRTWQAFRTASVAGEIARRDPTSPGTLNASPRRTDARGSESRTACQAPRLGGYLNLTVSETCIHSL